MGGDLLLDLGFPLRGRSTSGVTTSVKPTWSSGAALCGRRREGGGDEGEGREGGGGEGGRGRRKE